MTIDTFISLFSLPFMQRAIVAGIVIGIAAAYLGVFITLRNLSFYADTIAHSALAGIALGLLFHLSPTLSAILFCIIIGLMTVSIKNRSSISLDTAVGVIFSAGLSLGVVLISLLPTYRSELFTILFGDILTLNWLDVGVAVAASIGVIIFLLYTSKRLLLMTFSPDFTFVRGINGTRLDYAFFVVTALTIAISIKIVGIILVTGLLILPAAIAKNLAKSFKQLVWLATGISVCSTLLGLSLSFLLDLPAGPTIILVSTIGFVLSLFVRAK